MKKQIFALLTLSFISSAALASTPVNCKIISLNDEGTRQIADTDLECEQKDIKVANTKEVGVIAISCIKKDAEVQMTVRLTESNTVISEGHSLSANSQDSFSSYYLTLNQDLVIHCSSASNN